VCIGHNSGLDDAVWRQTLKQMDNKQAKEDMKATQEKVDSLSQRNDIELQSLRDLIEVDLVPLYNL